MNISAAEAVNDSSAVEREEEVVQALEPWSIQTVGSSPSLSGVQNGLSGGRAPMFSSYGTSTVPDGQKGDHVPSFCGYAEAATDAVFSTCEEVPPRGVILPLRRTPSGNGLVMVNTGGIAF